MTRTKLRRMMALRGWLEGRRALRGALGSPEDEVRDTRAFERWWDCAGKSIGDGT